MSFPDADLWLGHWECKEARDFRPAPLHLCELNFLRQNSIGLAPQIEIAERPSFAADRHNARIA